MNNDHFDFIARQKQRQNGMTKATGTRSFKPWYSACGMFLAGASVATLIATQTDSGYGVAALAASGFIVAGLLPLLFSYSPKRRLHKKSQTDLYRAIMDGSRDARLVTDQNNKTIYQNDKFITLFRGIDVDPSLENLVRIFDQEYDPQTQFKILLEQVQRGLTDSIELSTHHRGYEVWYQITAQPIPGEMGYIHWRIDDITQRRTIDSAIREEREKLIDFTDNAPVGFFSVDEAGRFMFVNATLARWLGDDIQNLLSHGRLHSHFQDLPQDARPYDIVSGGGAKQMAEVIMKGPGGKTFAASISQAVVHEAQGKVRTRGVVHDLTAERAMRQALKASEYKFQRFFEEAPLGIGLVDTKGILHDANPTLAHMMGYNVEDIENKLFEDLIDETSRTIALEMMARIGKGRVGTAPIEITLKGREQNCTVQMHGRRLEGSDNIVLHFIDLSQQKALEMQFVQSQKMQAIGQLAGGVAHDFNNLLTAMIGFCDLLLLRHKAGDPSFSDIMQIKQNANRAANLVRQLLAFSRQQTLRPQVQDISDILTELSHLIRRLIGVNIELDVIHGADLGLVKVDAGQMEQVLINLAVNARDAMDTNGHLTVKTLMFTNREAIKRGDDEMPPGEWVTISVTDTGHGIPQNIIDRIFEPFFTTKDVGQGTGLGLATVYGIIRQTGGYLHVESIVNEGTTFTIYLPRAAEEEQQTQTTSVSVEDDNRDLTGTAKILLVEDEDAVRTFGSRALQNKGYEVFEADSGEAALAVIENNPKLKLDLLITDVIMPNMDGPTAAKIIREKNPTLKIIFISGYTEEKLKEHMGENIWFLPKPFTLKQLAAKVKEALSE
jgi:two-component system cell cycle sensor histidine kinase/response regulator CckA